MDVMDPITQIFGNFAFPTAIVVVLSLALFKILKSYKETVDKQKDDIKELNRQYHDDYAKFTEALNNNTNALGMLNKLVELISKEVHDDK